MQTNLSLTLSDICIERAEHILCQQLNYSLTSGHLYRILGENGAGKTSLLKVISGILMPLEGRVIVECSHQDDQDDRDLLTKNSLYLGHRYGIKSHLSVLENVTCYCPQASNEKIKATLMHLKLCPYQHSLVKYLSEGQRKRVALARLWLSEKAIWLLDEPFASLDKDGVALLEDKFQDHIHSGGLIVLTSHQELSSVSAKTIELLS